MDGNHDLVYIGFNDLINDLNQYIKKVDNYIDILEIGAKEFVSDLSKLTKPYSEIHKSGYTHLIDTFTYKKTNVDIEVGWGKYYGRMVEEGTTKMKAQSHLQPMFDNNKNKYYQKMLEKFYN